MLTFLDFGSLFDTLDDLLLYGLMTRDELLRSKGRCNLLFASYLFNNNDYENKALLRVSIVENLLFRSSESYEKFIILFLIIIVHSCLCLNKIGRFY